MDTTPGIYKHGWLFFLLVASSMHVSPSRQHQLLVLHVILLYLASGSRDLICCEKGSPAVCATYLGHLSFPSIHMVPDIKWKARGRTRNARHISFLSQLSFAFVFGLSRPHLLGHSFILSLKPLLKTENHRMLMKKKEHTMALIIYKNTSM